MHHGGVSRSSLGAVSRVADAAEGLDQVGSALLHRGESSVGDAHRVQPTDARDVCLALPVMEERHLSNDVAGFKVGDRNAAVIHRAAPSVITYSS